MRRTIFIDIETLPAINSASPAAAVPGTLMTENLTQSPMLIDDIQRKTALSGDFGRILCIGFVDESPRGGISRGVLGWDANLNGFHCDERGTLSEFWGRMKTFRPNVDRIVGHNIFDFDLKFILKRSIINRIRPTVDLSFARYRNQPIFDTMYEWERWSFGQKVSLDTLAKALGLESSKRNGIDGSQIFDLYQAGQHRTIYDYCLGDVDLTRAIYKRMVFDDISQPVASPALAS